MNHFSKKEEESKRLGLKFSPSAIKRWTECEASAALSVRIFEEELPPEASSATVGKREHAKAEKKLKALFNAKKYVGEDLEDATQEYVDYCMNLHAINCSHSYGIEDKIEIFDKVFNTRGVIDFYSWDDTHLHVVDFKSGFMKVEELDQLMVYAGALVRQSDLKKIEEVSLHIVQPNVDHFLVETFGITTVKEAYDAFLKAASRVVIDYPGNYKTGKHCKYCPALALCPAFMQYFQEQKEKMEKIEIQDKNTIDDLIKAVLSFPEMEQFNKAAKAKLIHSILQKELNHPLLAVAAKNSYNWNDSKEIMAYIRMAGKEELIKPAKTIPEAPKSFTEVTKKIAALKDEKFYTKSSGQPYLKILSKKAKPKKVFKKEKDNEMEAIPSNIKT